MSEARDPAIKLFGRMIPLPESQAAGEPVGAANPCPTDTEAEEGKGLCREPLSTKTKSTTSERSQEMDQIEPDASSTLNGTNEEDGQGPKKDDRAFEDAKTVQELNKANGSGHQKPLKKPDQVLPCPRCNSLDTKFCYFNNYNVNQPRHFCKNCQRYWTAGGTMRNVPVGAGRRKNKHSSSHYRHVLLPHDAIPLPQVEHPDTVHTQVINSGLPGPMRPLKGNGTVLKFGIESPLRESMSSVLNLGDQKRNGEIGPAVCGENGEEPSCASSVTALNGVENKFPDNSDQMEQNDMQPCCDEPNAMQHLHRYPGPPWAYTCAPGWNCFDPVAAGHCPSELMYGQQNGNTNQVTWNTPVMMTAPLLCPPAIPFPYTPASFWGCMSRWANGTWNMPWIGATGGVLSSSSAISGGGSGNTSPTLGKHSRDVSLPVEEKIEKSLWIPKTLRIDDPDEAAKSSIWVTLGIKPDSNEPIKGAGIFKAFRPKTEGGNHPSGAQVLHVNPAALSRSQTFQEST